MAEVLLGIYLGGIWDVVREEGCGVGPLLGRYRGALTVEIGSLEGTGGVVYGNSRWTVSALWFPFLGLWG